MVRILLIYSFLMLTYASWAQDEIHNRDGSIVPCRIELVDDYVIQFREIADSNSHILYTMDATLVDKIYFDVYNLIKPIQYNVGVTEPMSILKTNIDGPFRNYVSLFLESVREGYSFDFGLKYLYNKDQFILNHKGLALEFGYSIPLMKIGTSEFPIRALNLRAYGVLIASRNQSFFDESSFNTLEYGGGLQVTMPFQLSKQLMLEGYYGLVGTVKEDDFFISNRGDISGINTIKRTTGLRIGYIF